MKHSLKTCGVPAVLVLCFLLTACRQPADEPKPTVVIRIAAAPGVFPDERVDFLKQALQKHFQARVERIFSNLPGAARPLEEGEVEMAVIPTNTAYLAYTKGWGDLPRPHAKLRGVAALNTLPLQLVTTEASGIRNWRDIRGRRVAIDRPGSTTEVTTKMALEALGLTLADFRPVQVRHNNEILENFRTGSVDAVFHRSYEASATLEKLMQVPGARLISLSTKEIEMIRSRYPFLHSTSIPAGMYGNHPGISTIGVDSVMVCRSDLPEELVYWITRALVESMTTSVPVTNAVHQPDPDQVHATPIPLHPGAARYYRERELLQ
jgi:TRAP transporter TAXI family solute receptor